MRKADYFNKVIAERKGLDLKVVKRVNAYYWKKGVKRTLMHAEHRSLFVKNIGTLTVSLYKTNKEILELVAKLRKIKANTRLKETTKVLIIEQIGDRIKTLWARRDEIAVEVYNNVYGKVARIPEAGPEGTEECG